jgi:dTDP-4-amino-4,6-dideoxygalactose transaminase
MNLDPSRIEAALTPKTRAIIPVHFSGLSCDMDAILSIAARYRLKVVEDAAHALPTKYRGTLVGGLESDAAVFSFYATKTITTGEGGMVVTRAPGIADRCRVMRLHGINRDAFDRYTSTKPAWFYEVVEPGFKYNMTDLAASLGIHQLKKAWFFQEKRAALAARYDEAFMDLPLVPPPHAPDGDLHAWHLYVIRLLDSAPVNRNRFIELLAEKNIGSSVHFIPLHLHPYWRNRYGLKPEDFPCSLTAYERAVSLPLYTRMSFADQDRVTEAVRNILT